MAQTKNLCAQIPTALHAQVCAAREQSGLTTAQYITNLLLEYYEMKENGGKTTMANNSRTMAFQIPETLFQRIKAHLERETQRTGRKLTQREFVLGLIEEALEAAERQAVEDIPEPEEEQPSEDAGVSPCEAQPEGGDTQPQEDVDALIAVHPAVFHRQPHTVQQKAVEDLGLNGNALIPGVCQQGLGDTVETVLFRFVAVVVVQIQI